MNKKWLSALTLLAGLTAGLILPRLISAVPALADGGYCYEGLCHVKTSHPTGVLVWIEDSRKHEMYLETNTTTYYSVSLWAKPRE